MLFYCFTCEGHPYKQLFQVRIYMITFVLFTVFKKNCTCVGMHIWPTVADLNTRARRLVTHFLKCQKQEEQRQAKLQRIKEKKEREKEVSRKKMLKRMEQAEKWSKREEQDFSRVISFYGVERNVETSEYDWSKFRSVYTFNKLRM